MNPKIRTPFFSLDLDNSKLSPNQENLYRTLNAALSYIPLLSLFIALGFSIIFLLGYFGLLDKNEPRLLVTAGISVATAILYIPLFKRLRKGMFDNVALLILIINCFTLGAQVVIWKGILWLPFAGIIIPSIFFAFHPGINRPYRALSIISGVICIFLIYVADNYLTLERMSAGDSLTQMAALTIYIVVFVAMAFLIILNSQIRFYSISSRLATTFTFIALLSSITTLIIAALANIYFDRQKIFLELNAASRVRADQIGITLDSLGKNVSLTLTDPQTDFIIHSILYDSVNSQVDDDTFNTIRNYLRRVLAQNPSYQEIFLVDGKGKNITSSMDKNINLNYASYSFFQNAKIGINYAVESNFPSSFDKSSIIFVRPILQNNQLQGILAVRVNFDSIKQILSAETGIGNTAESYLVGLSSGFMIPYSNTRFNTDSINTHPAEEALMFQSDKGSGLWDNYTGASVLGSYIRIPALKAVLITEIEQQEVTQKTISISSINAIIGIFTLLLTFIIVLITSRSIGSPIVNLADNATKLASGKFDTQINITRQDEIGTLAANFNVMAKELQSLIGTLEDKVEERTQELSKQTNYLRVAAEVARDATTSNNLEELLSRAAQLVLDRFDFYHTGIFLIDEQKEFAILRASPTQAGKEMLSRRHKLKVGQVGIVGTVASTGISRVVLDTSKDSTYFNNPLLPKTLSEAAIPLKVNDEIIGVLDVQSDQPNAFTQDDIGIFQIMSDQLALAIQHVKLSQEQEDNLHQLEATYQIFTFNNWNNLRQRSTFNQGYSFDGMNVVPISEMPVESRNTLTRGQSLVFPNKNSDNLSSVLAVPLMVRSQAIGILKIQYDNQTISSDTIGLIEDIAGRLANALENARLFSETQRSVVREQTVSQITSKIRSSNDPKEMVQIALNEIKKTLRANDARILPYTAPKNTKKA